MIDIRMEEEVAAAPEIKVDKPEEPDAQALDY